MVNQAGVDQSGERVSLVVGHVLNRVSQDERPQDGGLGDGTRSGSQLRMSASSSTGKGGAIEWIHWQTGTALLLPRLLAGRAQGPVFLTDRKPTRPVASLGLCPITGRARLSYRRAAEIFEYSTRHLAHPDATADQLAELDGWTLHQLRHSQLTHEAESGTNTPSSPPVSVAVEADGVRALLSVLASVFRVSCRIPSRMSAERHPQPLGAGLSNQPRRARSTI
ncbi:hypothetical protein AB0B45_48270 [Nonomuraea sp. NPDC049152]|uniref:hypothetical protein n=1 Tax=Nonomuraea sp. NPDC049152 TaxID=3154350 RepID=UPI0033DA465B